MTDANLICQEMFRDHLRQERYNHYTVLPVWLLIETHGCS